MKASSVIIPHGKAVQRWLEWGERALRTIFSVYVYCILAGVPPYPSLRPGERREPYGKGITKCLGEAFDICSVANKETLDMIQSGACSYPDLGINEPLHLALSECMSGECAVEALNADVELGEVGRELGSPDAERWSRRHAGLNMPSELHTTCINFPE